LPSKQVILSSFAQKGGSSSSLFRPEPGGCKKKLGSQQGTALSGLYR